MRYALPKNFLQKGLRSAGGPKLLKWGLPGRGVQSAKVPPTQVSPTTPRRANRDALQVQVSFRAARILREARAIAARPGPATHDFDCRLSQRWPVAAEWGLHSEDRHSTLQDALEIESI